MRTAGERLPTREDTGWVGQYAVHQRAGDRGPSKAWRVDDPTALDLTLARALFMDDQIDVDEFERRVEAALQFEMAHRA